MPRQARVISPEGFFHVISRGNNRRQLFYTKKDFGAYRQMLQDLKAEESIKIFHYCLMINHVHILLKLESNSDLSRFIKRLNLRYSHHYRKRRSYVGYLWQGRFKSKIIEKDEYFLQCGKYIELNPVRAGIAKLPQEYAYSSYLHYAYGVTDKLIDNDPFYLDLSEDNIERQNIYRNILLHEIEYKRFKI